MSTQQMKDHPDVRLWAVRTEHPDCERCTGLVNLTLRMVDLSKGTEARMTDRDHGCVLTEAEMMAIYDGTRERIVPAKDIAAVLVGHSEN